MDLKINFKFDKNIKKGYYSAKYFLATKKILEKNNSNNKTLLRFKHFDNNVVVAGIQECLQLIKFALPRKVYKNTKIYYVNDGTITNADEPILAIEGDYKEFGYLENIIDGILSRRSSIATNVHKIIKEVGKDNIIFMADRSDDYTLQPYDGYAAYIGGMRKFVTIEQTKFLQKIDGIQVLGTIPHALIQQHNGSLYNALMNYRSVFPNSSVVGLIDFNNDCLNELRILRSKNFDKLDFVRIDTSKKMIDKSLQEEFKKTWDKNLHGVNSKLISLVRKELDKLGYKETKIIVSSGINLESIKDYKQKKSPIDIYGVGKSFLNININFTGDLIKLNDKYLAKVGREENIDSYLEKMNQIN